MNLKEPYDFPENFNRHYKIPEDYFLQLENKGIPAEKKRIRLLRYKRIIMAAAVFLLLFGLGKNLFPSRTIPTASVDTTGVYTNEFQTGTQNDTDLSDIPDEVIEEYLLTADDILFDI